jgi:hypothetical protein
MQGLFVRSETHGWHRPASKREVVQALASSLNNVRVEATSFFGNEPEGRVIDLMDSAPHKIAVVGPDPHKRRNFYGTLNITRQGANFK